MTKRHRSAVDGQYVTEEQAKADPERTVGESPVRHVRGKVVLEVDRPIAPEQRERLREVLGNAFPEGFVILEAGIRLSSKEQLDRLEDKLDRLLEAKDAQ